MINGSKGDAAQKTYLPWGPSTSWAHLSCACITKYRLRILYIHTRQDSPMDYLIMSISVLLILNFAVYTLDANS